MEPCASAHIASGRHGRSLGAMLLAAPRSVPSPSPDSGIDWPRTIASVVVYGGLLLILGLSVLAFVLLVRWLTIG